MSTDSGIKRNINTVTVNQSESDDFLVRDDAAAKTFSSNVKLFFTDKMSVLLVVLSCHHDLVVVRTVSQQLPSFPRVTDGTAGRHERETPLMTGRCSSAAKCF